MSTTMRMIMILIMIYSYEHECLGQSFEHLSDLEIPVHIDDFVEEWTDPIGRYIWPSHCFTQPEKRAIIHFFQEVPFISWFQLQGVEELSLEAISCFLELHQVSVTLRETGERNERHRLSLQVRPRNKSYSSIIRFKSPLSQKLELGGLLEKDEKEKLWGHYGPDYSSLYLHYNHNAHSIKQVILGDFKIRWGQGLLLNNFFRKGLVFTPNQIPAHEGFSLRPYGSLDENRALRGGAVRMRMGNWENLSFLSCRQQDVRLDTTQHQVKSLSYSGLHSTATERNGKDALWLWLAGSAWQWNTKRVQLTLNTLYKQHSLPWAEPHRIDLLTTARLQRVMSNSTAYRFDAGRVQFVGELAYQYHGASAHIHSVFWQGHPSHRLCLSWRYVEAGFDAQHTQSFFKRSYQPNERGFFLGYIFEPSRNLHFFINYDQYEFPFWTYLQSPFRWGEQVNLGCNWEQRRKWKWTFSYRFRQRDESSRESFSTLEKRHTFRAHYIYHFDRGIEFRSRLELSYQSHGPQQSLGWLHYTEWVYKPIGSQTRITWRVTAYETPGFENSIYAYTHGLGGSFTIPAYFDRGIEQYLLLGHGWRGFRLQGMMRWQWSRTQSRLSSGLRLQVSF